MLVTLSGMVMLVRLEQSRNAPPPMLVTLLGIVMLFRPVHSQNALSPTVFIFDPWGTEKVLTLYRLSKA